MSFYLYISIDVIMSSYDVTLWPGAWGALGTVDNGATVKWLKYKFQK